MSDKPIDAIPVARAGEPVPAFTPTLKAAIEKRTKRSEIAKQAWKKRRANAAHPTPDRHATGGLTVAEALELAELVSRYPLLRKVLLCGS
jgi:hypothetical protein